MKLTLITTLAVTVAALATAGTAAPRSTAPRLVATVGPGFTISLKRNGKLVRTLKAGRYTFAVSDKASIHNFVLEGPRFERALTTVPFTGRKTITITLKKGKWEYYCAPHESTMHGDFRVV